MDKTKMLHIRVSETWYKDIKHYCVEKDISVTQYINDLLLKDSISRKKRGGGKGKKKK